jgi:hypothetical protein
MPQHWNATAREQVCEYILDAMAEGQSLSAILRGPLMPSPGTFARWRAESEVLQGRYARAREALADRWADEVVPISDGATDSDSAAAARVRMDARRWAASKFAPSTYGERVDVGLTGAAGLQIVLGRYDAPRDVTGTVQALPATGEAAGGEAAAAGGQVFALPERPPR